MANFTQAQLEAIQTLDVNMAVSAGAGAGKTRVLVERYIHILREKHINCAEILAITFTNKAAKEMKERIRAQINQLADGATTLQEQRFWQQVKNQLGEAPIGTFHSFCARLLQQNPVEAGLDPDFAVLEQVDDQLMVAKVFKQVMEDNLAAGSPWLERLLKIFSREFLGQQLPAIYEQVNTHGGIDRRLARRLERPYQVAMEKATDLKAQLKELCSELIAGLGLLGPKSQQFARVERLANHWLLVAQAIDEAGGEEDAPYDILTQYLGCLDKRSKDKVIVGEIKERLADLFRIKADKLALVVIPDLCQLLQEVKLRAEQLKIQEGVLTFNDLELRAAALLHNNSAICLKYNQSIRQIMVDEFQDTNELQRQIIYLLAGGHPQKLRGNKLFVVGDVKQSIYRFRGADVAVFAQVKKDILASGGRAVAMDINFRSMDGLLNLYNECFAAIMGTQEDTIAFQPLRAHRAGEDSPVRAEFLAIAKSQLPEGLLGREAEAQAVAQRIVQMVVGQEKLIDHDSTPRKVAYGDIAILFRTAKIMEIYAAKLQRVGAPYYILGGRGFYNCQEITDILNLLQVVDNRFQKTALVGVLRSPIFQLSDDTILKLTQCGQLWQGLADAQQAGLTAEQAHAAKRAWLILNKLRSLRSKGDLVDLLQAALDETGYQNMVLTQFMGQQKYANLNKMVTVAQKFQQRGQVTLRDFLLYIEQLVELEVKEGEAQIDSEAGDTVKLMTIHKSKGLEYPVVFVPDLHRKFNMDTQPILFHPGHGLGLKVPSGADFTPTTPYQEISAEEKILSSMEMKRLFYVALTRAKDYLVLSGVGDQVGGDRDYSQLNSWLGWLGRAYGFGDMSAMPVNLGVHSTLAVQSGVVSPNQEVCLPQNSDDGLAKVSALDLATIVRNIGPAAESCPPASPVFSATRMETFRHCPRAYYYRYIAQLPDNGAPGRASEKKGAPGQLVGTVLHRSLEVLANYPSRESCLEEVVAVVVPARWRRSVKKEAAPLLDAYLTTDFYQESTCWPISKEWQFDFFLADPAEAGRQYHLTGSIDCLLDYGDKGYGIIDYKASRLAPGQGSEKAGDYGLQLVLYALAVEAVRGKPVCEAGIYFWRSNELVPVPIDKAAQEKGAAAIIETCRFTTFHDQEHEYVCNLDWCSQCSFPFFCPRR